MEADIKRLHELRQEGKGCAQILLQLALELNGEENPAVIRCMSGLCIGVHSGLVCGALTGAACMLSYFDPQLAAEEMIPELATWFQETFEEKYGGIDCRDILQGDSGNRALRCPQLIEQTYCEAKEILEEYGFDLTEMAESRWED